MRVPNDLPRGIFRVDDKHFPGGFELFDQFDVRIVDALQVGECHPQAG